VHNNNVPVAELVRISKSDSNTIGFIQFGDACCLTIEPPWKDNQVGISSIPTGTYMIKHGMYNAGGYPAYELVGVEGRTQIKIHAANKASQLQGCIALGQEIAVMDGEVAVTSSRYSLDLFMEYMDKRDGVLLISEA